ncbi:MAG: alpha/beta hydrolase fold domain-containing protein [Bryobacteraceae bacterium]|jgi:acetyl esterase/lipase/predicted enzyme related to lactoylglutathione lyase
MRSCFLLLLSFGLVAQGAVSRPPIVGVAHVALRTNDLAAARNFYGRVLGFPTLITGTAYFQVNARQYIEVHPDLTNDSQDRLIHIAFETTDAKQLRDYLASRGVKVPDEAAKDRNGDLSFELTDPDGHVVEFVQYLKGDLYDRDFGKDLPATRVSERIIHAGFIVKDREAEDRFYRDILGFRETWHGGMKDRVADWVDMRVPDGADWLEYMLNVHDTSARTRGVMNHLALGVPDVQPGYRTVVERGLNPEKPKIGRDGKWQLNLYDPNFTRAELMEPKPVETPCCSKFVTDIITYGAPGGEQLTMDYYAPSGPGPHPVAIIIHGGGFTGGTSRNGSEAYCAEFLAPAGYAVFSINYHLAPKYPYPDMLHDVQRAIRYIRYHASEWDANRNKIALVGGSAGGWLSNMAGLIDAPGDPSAKDPVDRESSAVQAVVTIFGPSDFRGKPVNPNVHALLDPLIKAKGEAAALAEASPITYVRKDAPPFLLVHGDKDKAVDFSESTNLRKALREAGAECDLIRIPNGPHVTDSWNTIPDVPDWEHDMTVWLNAKLRHEGPVGEGIRARPQMSADEHK